MLRVESFVTSHLPGLQSLFNCHLSAVVPGWTLPAHVIAESLERDPCEYVTDPWVVERRTLCAVERGRVLAAAHLLRYGSGPEVSEGFRSAGALEWFLAWPPAPSSRYVFAYSFDEAAEAVLAAAVKQLSSWEVTRQYGGTNLPVPVVSGVPGQWPHISSRLEGAGFKPNPELEEVIYAGALEGPAAPAEPPVPGLELVVTTADGTVRLAGVLDGGTIGHCGWDLGAGRGGEFPALTAWAELADLWVEPAWRRRGVGTWLLLRAATWLRFARFERVVFSVAAEAERAGAGAFYATLGWRPLARLQRGHERHPAAREATG